MRSTRPTEKRCGSALCRLVLPSIRKGYTIRPEEEGVRMSSQTIEAHNTKPAAVWASAGRQYERISETIAGFFKVMKSYLPPPPAAPPPSPFEWGRRERVQQLLGGAFDLRFETGTTVLREPSGEAVWQLFVSSYGPTKALAASLDEGR